MVKAILNDFAENCYILYHRKEAYVIDPGSNYSAMREFIDEKELTIKGVLLTHGHYDHIIGVNDLLKHYDATIYIHHSERDFLFDPTLNLSSQMQMRYKVEDKLHVETIDETKTFTLGNDTIKVIFTPGHTRGGVSYHYKHFLFSGDALFKGTIGRTDLPTGNQTTLIRSCKMLLKTLSNNTLVYPGHGHFTTIANEKANNPYLSR